MFPKNNPSNAERILRTMRNPHQGFPWTGYSGMDLSSTDKAFNCSMRVYQLPFADCSRPEHHIYNKFDDYCSEFKRRFKIGDNVNAILVNGQLENNKSNVGISGQIAKFMFDYANNRIRVFVRSDKDFSVHEVYPETLFDSDVVAEAVQNKIDENYKLILS